MGCGKRELGGGGRGGEGGEKVDVCIYMVAVSLLVIMLRCHGVMAS